jgi:hypothetical protein
MGNEFEVYGVRCTVYVSPVLAMPLVEKGKLRSGSSKSFFHWPGFGVKKHLLLQAYCSSLTELHAPFVLMCWYFQSAFASKLLARNRCCLLACSNFHF